ncbi:hypothetical protein [Chryseobacterium sp. BIGb0232]|uniref:hypothetical protein n=1 Tax=Chryseobacterium sp. BIGb0232 TaxID=2940598 RepID=UPI000F469B57|nr:hypothetical protein [Chryseobacterium sp. BIGb0232]MCS4302305.1 hypothetical protein [Chryseobacterium sp. BIGb0232]ROS18250.1 hypothetical protein EDF65_2642 [Chryseobacterium nakagawai]
MKSFLILVLFISISCSDKQKKETNEIITTPQCLQPQLQAGFSAEKSETDYPNYTYGQTDLDCAVPILESELIKKGYKSPSNEEFSQKVLDIFKRKIDYSIDSKYIYLDGKNSCNKSIAYNRNTDDEMEPTSYYLIKNNRFITELFAIPEIIDYSTAFPETKSFEDKVNNIQNDVHITKWNEDKNLSQKRFENINKLVARNKYLFNNSKADLAWLLANDKEFLKKLVITFGYDKEQKINKQVIDDLYKSYTQSGQIWYGAKLGEVFFTKDCQGKLQTQEGLLNYVSQNTNENDDRFIYALSKYIVYLFKEDKDGIFSEAPSKKFTLEEKAKIVAYVANIESPAFYKYKPLNSNSAWRNAGTSLYNITAAHPEILKIIEKNNYYGLTALKEVINSTQFEEEAPITNQSGE